MKNVKDRRLDTDTCKGRRKKQKVFPKIIFNDQAGTGTTTSNFGTEEQCPI